jgi:nucleotide-binding universal stress UspA family protein
VDGWNDSVEHDSGRPRVVVGVDGSAGSRAALLWALPAAAARGARLEVLAACPVDFYWTDVYLSDPRRLERIRSDTATRAHALVEEVRSDPAAAGTGGTPVDVVVVPGPAAEQLIARSRGADLLVVGSRGRSEIRSTLLGSVALHCAAHARCPVVVVHPSRPEPGAPVVVGLDDTPAGRDALRRGLDEAARLGADVEVETVFLPIDWWAELPAILPERVDRMQAEVEQRARRIVSEVLSDVMAARTAGDRPTVRVQAVEGCVTDVLVHRAEGARLLVVGSRSRSRLVGMALGSAALHCVVHAPCPVMVVHPAPVAPRRTEAAADAREPITS